MIKTKIKKLQGLRIKGKTRMEKKEITFSTTKEFTSEMIKARSSLTQTMELTLNLEICAKD
jgi:hypothetical protein